MNNKISNYAQIGNNVELGNNIIIHDNVKINDNVKIGSYCEIGLSNNDKETIIGKDTKINSHAIIYGNVKIENNCIIGHRVLIRENTFIENNTQIGSYSDLEGFLNIGKYVKIHSNVHIGQFSNIKSFAWLFPYCILTNDPTPPSDYLKGPEIGEFSIVATRTTVLPAINIGFGAFIGANSLVNRNIPPEVIASGNPISIRGDITRIRLPNSRTSAYPWALRYKSNFYPLDLANQYQILRSKYI